MITVTENAQKELDSFFTTYPDSEKSVRIYMAPGGCCGPSLNMALDKANEGVDLTEEVNGIVYCMTPELAEMTGAVTLDVSYMGFMLQTERQLPGGGSCGSGGCSGCGSGGSCCGS